MSERLVGRPSLVIAPEPTPSERAALAETVGRAVTDDGVLEPPPAYRSRWREQSASEAVEAGRKLR